MGQRWGFPGFLLRSVSVAVLLSFVLAAFATAAYGDDLVYDQITLPYSQPGTLTPEAPGPLASHVYQLALTAGQTVAVRCTVATESMPLGIIAQSPLRYAWLFPSPATGLVRAFTLMAPERGVYFLGFSGSTAATYTLQVETTAAAQYVFSKVRVVAASMKRGKRAYWAATGLSPEYDGFYCPLATPPSAYSPFRYVIEQKRRSKWVACSSAVARVPSSALDAVGAWFRLPRGKYRVHLRLRDAAHPRPLYGPFRLITVR